MDPRPHRTRSPLRLIALGIATALASTGCSAGSLGSSGGDGTTLTFLVDTSDSNLLGAEALAAAFMEENPDVTIEVGTRPGGAEGDNLVKTRLATGDMDSLFYYNSGSLFRAIGPEQNLVPAEGAQWVEGIEEVFASTVSVGDQVYGAPMGAQMGGGILYNRRVYEELGLQVPTTWEAFMANNAAIDAAGVVPVIQTYQDTPSSQLIVLGDFHNVATAEPDFAERYTANQAKFATTPAALRAFEHMEEINRAGYMNEDFASTDAEEGLRMLGAGEGVHYPALTASVASIPAEQVEDIGFFPVPGDDPATFGLTLWTPGAVYIPNTTEGAELEAAQEFQAFIASPEACEVQSEASPPTGPYAVDGCELPADVPPATEDLQAYIDAEGKVTPALEFLSPVKGPALEQILVEVGSGIRPAADGAALYDEDVVKQAQQLGLEGW